MREIKRPLIVGLGLICALACEAAAQTRVETVAFNWNTKNSFKDPLRGFKRFGDNLEDVLIKEIQQAHLSIEIAVFQLNLPKLAKALAKKKSEGVQVRVIVDNQYSRPISEFLGQDRTFLNRETVRRLDSYLLIADEDRNGQVSALEVLNTDAMAILKNADIPVIDDTADGSMGSGIMHHKFVIIDKQIVATGSANFASSDVFGDADAPATRGNANSILVINSAAVAKEFYEEFAIMWGDRGQSPRFGIAKPQRPVKTIQLDDGTVLQIKFAPQASALIKNTLKTTRKSADLGLFVFSDQEIANELLKLSSKGIHIRTLVEGSFAYRWYSEVLDMLGLSMLDARCRNEPNNHPWQNPIKSAGAPKLPEGDKFHHKFAILDHQKVIYGSYNWSVSAETQNDETLMVIENPTLAEHFEEEFQRHYANAYLGTSTWLQRQIDAQNNGCVATDSTEGEPIY